MTSFLKPTTTNLLGTGLLLVATWAGSIVSRLISTDIMGSTQAFPTVQAGNYSGYVAGAGRAALRGSSLMGTFGLASGAIEAVILAVLFYVIVSYAMSIRPKESEEKKQTKAK